VWSPLRSLMEAGRHEELVARAQPLLDDEPPYPELLYNVACSESLLGRTDDALGHLRRAVELLPEIARFARDDEDLVALRDEPAFTELTGE
jgi:tetratricopeptide (TPR) repeat protein